MAKIIPLLGLSPNSSYSISVRGKTADGAYTPWSQFKTFSTTKDSTPPNTPAAPTIQEAGPQNVVVTHNLTTSLGAGLDKDVRYLEVYISNSQDSYATETYAGNIPIGPLASGSVSQSFFYPVPSNPTDISAKARVRAVDASGNISEYSSLSTASGAIAYFDAAYIGNLTADTISASGITTGTLQANVAISVGTTSPIVIKSNPASPYGQMYLGTGTYGDANTPFYVDSTNKFSLGSNLTWDGSTLTVNGNGTFNGTINASAGDFTGYVTAGGTSIGKNWAIGATTYSGLKIDDSNFFGRTSGGTAVFQVSNGTNYMSWNGSLLSIKGSLAVTGGSFENYMTAGNIYVGKGIAISGQTGVWDGIRLNDYNFWADQSGAVKFQVGDINNYLKWDSSTLQLKGQFTAGGASNTAIKIGDPTVNSNWPGVYLFNSASTLVGGINIASGGNAIFFESIDTISMTGALNTVNSKSIQISPSNVAFNSYANSQSSVVITHPTPTGALSANRTIRNIWATIDGGGTPADPQNGDVWLVWT